MALLKFYKARTLLDRFFSPFSRLHSSSSLTPLLDPFLCLSLALQAYLHKAGFEVVKGGHLVPLLGVFQKLISSKAHDHEGFDILNAIVENLPISSYESYLPDVFKLLFSR
jgi:hypothetical protein